MEWNTSVTMFNLHEFLCPFKMATVYFVKCDVDAAGWRFDFPFDDRYTFTHILLTSASELHA
jgi:hypothetical protein